MLSLWPRFLWLLPVMPATCLAWLPGVSQPLPTRGFTVDASDRADVVSFYHAVYMASEGYQSRINWTGVYNSTAAGAEGTVSADFVADVERRLNYFRAMCGVKANVRVNTGATVNIQPGDAWIPAPSTTKAEAAQRSALMIIRTYPGNGGLSHNPPTSNTAWTTAAWNANWNGNLALGFYGPGAVNAYFKEDVAGISSWNVDVGHRRWLLGQWSTDFATGDTPGSFAGGTARPPTNVMYVVPKTSELDFTPARVFAAYPPAGHVPAGLNSPYWSLSYPGADFSAATVTLRDSALNPVPVTIVSRRTGFGDNSIVWQVPAAAAVTAVASDQSWHVTVSGIQGTGVPTQSSYQVTLINPDVLPAAPVVGGTTTPVATGAVYQIAGVTGAEQMEAGMFLRRATAWTEGAETSPAPRVVDRTSGSYPFLSTTAGYVFSGSRSFRLTFPTYYDPLINGVPQQSFEVDREIVPGSAGTLDFKYRRGLMTSGSKLVAESSSDGGLNWSALAAPIAGLGGSGDASFKSASYPLPAGVSPLRIRFRYYLETPTSSMYSHEDYPSHPTGIFIDDITTGGCDWLEPGGTVRSAGLASFTFDSSTAGMALEGGQEWWLRARAVLGGHAFPHGPALVVNPVGPLRLIGTAAPPTSGANYAFVPDPAADGYRFEVVRMQPATWTEGAENLPSATVSDATESSYALADSLAGYVKSGTYAFRLGLSNTADNVDSFTIERVVIPSATSNLSFWLRRGRMSKTNFLHAELSSDGGTTWSSLWSIAGKGGTSVDSSISQQVLSLGAWAGSPVKLRFAVRKAAGGSNATWSATKSGAWLDDITVSAATEPGTPHETAVDGGATMVRLDGAAAGEALQAGSTLRLRMRGMSGAVAGAWGPALTVAPVADSPPGFTAWKSYEYPGHDLPFDGDNDLDGFANGVEYAFSLDLLDGMPVPDDLSLPAGRLEISRDLPAARADISYDAEWTDNLVTWSSAGVQIVIDGGRITASAPKGAGGRFMRWKITAN